MQLGFIGLGKMGIRMAEKLLGEGHVVIGWNRTREVVEEFRLVLQEKQKDATFIAAEDIKSLVKSLTSPRVVWVMLPAGEATQTALEEIAEHVEEGDIVIDGGNAFYKDTQRRFEEFEKKKVKYLGIGVSGGIIAEKEGYPMMVGGDKSAYASIYPILDSLAKPHGGHAYLGTGGAGHFVKMIHNGIEYGMMQAIGEGFGVMEKAPYALDLLEVAKLWQKGTIVDSFLIDRAKDALEKNVTLDDIIGQIDATGEAEWTVRQGQEEQVPVDVIAMSLAFRSRSKSETAIQESFAARMVAALRREFGGHAVKKK